MKNPENLLYAESHEWLKVEGGEGVIGITDFAQDSLGDITFIELPQVGEKFTQGQEMGTVESVKAASDIYMPCDCEVIAVNEEAVNNPELVNKDPYGSGWLIRVSIQGATDGLLNAEDYAGKCVH